MINIILKKFLIPLISVPEIKTERRTLRLFSEAVLPEFFEILETHRDMFDLMVWKPPKNLEKAKEQLLETVGFVKIGRLRKPYIKEEVTQDSIQCELLPEDLKSAQK